MLDSTSHSSSEHFIGRTSLLTLSSLLRPSTILSLLLPTCRQIAVTQRHAHRPAHQAQLLQDRLVPQLVDVHAHQDQED
eukprot:9949260-Heterocapsa_arctica.AAC.1